MKTIQYLWTILALTCLLVSCKEETKDTRPATETADFKKVSSFSKDNYSIDLFTANGKLTTGYNKIYLQVKDPNGNFVKDAGLKWAPVMNMAQMSHACPYSSIQKKPETESVYEGYIVFTMASGEMGSWEVKFLLTIQEKLYEFTEKIEIKSTDQRNVSSFTGSDNQKYVVALIEPQNPKTAVNDMSAGLFRMETMMNFPIVNNYKIKIDPRMPSMGNHGSPNNQDLVQESDGWYHGKVSLTMTGYWVINLMIENAQGELLKGEPVSNDQEKSSLFFDLEF